MLRIINSIFLFIILILVVEFYAFQALKTLTNNKIIKRLWVVTAFFVYVFFFYIIFTTPRSMGQTVEFQYALGLLLMFLIPKGVFLIVMFSEDIVRVIQKLASIISSEETKSFPGRRMFVSKMALGLASIPFAGFIYGMIQGRYNYKVLKYELSFEDLPESFDGLTITQFSDIHSGSFTNKEKIQYGVDLIKEQKSDLLLFTGDIVNNKFEEMLPWVDMFKTLEAPLGKYSILGNHDYGDYSEWKSEEDKKVNFQGIKDLHYKIGFDLLLNEHRYIELEGEKIALIGIENWGKGFSKAGDLNKASEGVRKNDFKILMSHDPSHWEMKVKQDDFNYHLTLSGHTHGLQMGIEIPGILRWSPSQYIYKQWAGMYSEFGRYINVNRGFGYHAFPGRVGIWPEITVITLKKGSNNA